MAIPRTRLTRVGIPLSRRPWLRRLLVLATATLLLLTVLAGYAAWHHASGLWKLRATQEALGKEGRGATIADLLKNIPPSDRERHEAWWRWQESAEKETRNIDDFYRAWDSDDARKWRIGLSTEPPADLLQSLKPFTASMTAMEPLLDKGPFIAGIAGHLVATARPDDPAWLLAVFQGSHDYFTDKWHEDATLHVPLLIPLRVAGQVLTIKTLTATTSTEREAAYRRLDALVAAHAHPIGIMETMEYFVLMAFRDDAHLWGALRRSIDPQRLRRWLDERTAFTSLQRIGAAYQAERLLRFDCLISLAYQGRLHQPTIYPGSDRWSQHWITWWYGPTDLPIALEALADLERRIERGPTYPYQIDAWVNQLRPHPLAHTLVPNLMECGVTATQHEFIARRARVIATLNQDWMMTRSLPADVDGVKQVLGPNASWLDRRPDTHELVYERLSDSRFRISINLNAGSDTFTPLERYQPRTDSTPPRRVSRSGAPLPPPPPPRTDLPPKTSNWQLVGYEVWLPD